MASSTPTLSARPITRKTAGSFRTHLVPSLSQDDKTFERRVEQSNFQYLMAVAEHYRLEGGKWNAASRFLFRCLTDALDLEDYEDFIVRAVTRKPGRRKNTELAEYICSLHAQGKTVPQIESILKRDGLNKDLTRESIRDYIKIRRREQKKTKL